ncbi:MAG: hypothetical protein FWH01_16695 [Oscillospiraceae bacterium]|nr:hypothetical protein [Oscillospiraceae bacterium]
MPNIKKIYFRLFGTFDVVVNKKSVLTKGVRQQGFNKLFIFFLLNHDRVFEINTLIDKVWPNKDYHDNNSIMRTQIFRLKRQLTELVPALDFKLDFTHGGYCFTYDPKNVVMDTDVFESLCAKIFSSKQAGAAGAAGASSAASNATAESESFSGFGADQPSRSLLPPLRLGSPGLQSSGPLSVPPISSYMRGRPEKSPGRPEAGFAVSGIQQSDSEIMKLCSDALRVYQSGFLNETAFDASWLESYRQNYRRMWLRVIETFTDVCNRNQNYADIITLCQEVLRFEDSEEYIHEIYMDALRNAGYHQDALRHYDVITSIPAHRDAFMNSTRLRDLQRSIHRETDNNKLIDEEDIEQYISDLSSEAGTFVCEKDMFLRHCSVLHLSSERSTHQPYVCIIETIGYNTGDDLFKRLNDISLLTNVLKNAFRKSDILCEWNDRQVLVLMACNQTFNAEALTQRIKLAILRDNLTPEEEANENLNLSERMFYLPLNIKIMPISDVVNQN